MIQTKKDFLMKNQAIVKTTNANEASLALTAASLAVKIFGPILLFQWSPHLAIGLSVASFAAKVIKSMNDVNVKDFETYQIKNIAKQKNISQNDLRVVEVKSLKTKKWSTTKPGVYVEYTKYENLPNEEKQHVDGIIAPKSMVPYAKMLLKEDPNAKKTMSPEKKAFILKLKQTEPHLAETYEKNYTEITELTNNNDNGNKGEQ